MRDGWAKKEAEGLVMSFETRWTSGPWVIDPVTRPIEVCTVHRLPDDERTDGQGWAYVSGALGHWDVSREEAMANAHLIAAAPDLYAALEDCITALEPYDDIKPRVWKTDREGLRRACQSARAALAKARCGDITC